MLINMTERKLERLINERKKVHLLWLKRPLKNSYKPFKILIQYNFYLFQIMRILYYKPQNLPLTKSYIPCT